jgi:hypothetical protein
MVGENSRQVLKAQGEIQNRQKNPAEPVKHV